MSTQRVQRVARWLIGCSVGLALGLGAAGCQETRTASGFRRPMPPKPRPLPRVPADARANALVLNVSAAPMDTNGNGYADLILASAHLFDRRYPPAMHEDGAFVFLLYGGGDVARPGSRPIHEWRIEGELLRQSYVRVGSTRCLSSTRTARSSTESSDRTPFAPSRRCGKTARTPTGRVAPHCPTRSALTCTGW